MTISQSPACPLPDEVVTLSISATTGTRVDFELTSVPPRSELTLGRLLDLSGEPIATFTPDVPGEYGFTAYDIRETGMAPPRFRGDPIGTPGKVVLGTQTGTASVAASTSLPITTMAGHGARLELRVVNLTVREAELLDPLTDLSRVAALQADVTSALTALEGVTIANLSNDLQSGVGELYTQFEEHREDTIPHGGDFVDTINAVRAYPPNSQQYMIVALNELYDRIVVGHMQAGAASPRWHDKDDGRNVPLAGKAASLAQATVTFSDLAYRVYERHRAEGPDIHTAADVINVLSEAAPLQLLIVAFFDAIAEIDPSVVAGENQGADQAAHRYGFAP
jgi:hypothetical protein